MIDQDVFKQISRCVNGLLDSYSSEIAAAMDAEGAVSISLPVKIQQKGENLDVDVKIGFIKERIKDSVSFVADKQEFDEHTIRGER